MGLDPDLEQPIARYSMGMKQKLGLAQAVMEDQRVLILDEPFNALDETSVENVHLLLRQKLADGCTLIFTSYNSDDVANLAQSAYRVRESSLIPLLQ